MAYPSQSTRPNSPHRGAHSIALTSDQGTRPQRTGFFPRAPGPNLILFALLIGVAPSLAASFYVLRTGLDGGFYMDGDFLTSQRNALAGLGLIVAIAAGIALVFVLDSFRHAGTNRGPRIVISMLLVLTIGWDGVFFSSLRSMLNTPWTYQQVQALADMQAPGVERFVLDRRAFRAEVVLSEGQNLADIPLQRAGPALCVAMGSVFRGPVDVIGLQTVTANGQVQTYDIPRVDCRTWYLGDRRSANQPQGAPHTGWMHISALIGSASAANEKVGPPTP